MEDIRDYRVVARNTAANSANKIHDDVVARRHGFSGGLVPGVDVYAYMTHPPAAAWGLDWLERGSLQARFVAPVYEGDEVLVSAGSTEVSAAGTRVELTVRNGEGQVCAVGAARLPVDPPSAPSLSHWPDVLPSDDPPPASPEALIAGTALALASHTARIDRMSDYLGDIGEELDLYTDQGVAHPGWLLRDANYVLSANVELGPWIHVESDTQHHGLVGDGDVVTARATVTREWEHKGHRFVELEVALIANTDRLVARVTHTAIYRPRAPEGTADS